MFSAIFWYNNIMLYKQGYDSPVGEMTLLADEKALLGAWFVGQKYDLRGFEQAELLEEDTAVLQEAKKWLDAYFAGEDLAPFPALAPKGTAFQQRVWEYLLTIPTGEARTYGQIAANLSCKSSQAIGGAVGRNPVSIFIPCHRVLGADGSLTGYAGGLDRKSWLLAHEKRR